MRQAALMSSGVFAASILVLGAAGALKITDYRNAASVSSLANIIEGRAALAFESQYNARFPVKTLGTNLWAAIDYALFDEGRPGVVLGKEDWLFSDEEFKTYADAETRARSHLALVTWVRDELQRRGSTLLIALLPSKARVYPEHLGRRKPSAIHADLYPRLARDLIAAGVMHTDLLGALKNGKTEDAVFLRTDTHWTPWGARVAAQAIARQLTSAKLAGQGSTVYHTQTAAPQPHRGDLFSFLPLDPYFAALLPPGEQIAVPQTASAAETTSAADLFGDDKAPTVALIGTSYSANTLWNFTGALQQALREDVVNYAQQGKGPFVAMLDYLARTDLPATPPRLVIWEVPERFFPVAYDFSAYRSLLPPELALQAAVPRPGPSTGH